MDDEVGSQAGSSKSSSSLNSLRQRATKIIKKPAEKLKKIKENELTPFDRETKHFVHMTKFHSPLRWYKSSGWVTVFWSLAMCFSLSILIWQLDIIIRGYVSKPVVSQVSFLIEDRGVQFPLVTFCNFNPIRKSYIEELNKTGNFPDVLVDYFLAANVEMQALATNADEKHLKKGDEAYKHYRSNFDPSMTVDNFYLRGGHNCPEIMRICSFGGRKFDCCKYATPILTPLGRCYTLDLPNLGEKWMQKQRAAGEPNGLQIILDVRSDEAFQTSGNESDPVFTNSYDNGFRYYIHAPETTPYVASEGHTVSPASRVYSSITSHNYVLLSRDDWGKCVDEWPAEYNTTLKYSTGNCALYCKAKYYFDRCGCTPFNYNVQHDLPSCSPLDMFNCMNTTMHRRSDNRTEYLLPSCESCGTECSSWEYHAYNSYGLGFSEGAVRWLNERDHSWSTDHIRNNFLAVSVFFRDLTYTQYNQIKGATISNTLSNIGSNLGMCFGISVITIIETVVFLLKMGWIGASKRRKTHMADKKKKEVNKERDLDRTLQMYQMEKQQTGEEEEPEEQTNYQTTVQKIRSYANAFVNSIWVRTGSMETLFNENTMVRNAFYNQRFANCDDESEDESTQCLDNVEKQEGTEQRTEESTEQAEDTDSDEEMLELKLRSDPNRPGEYFCSIADLFKDDEGDSETEGAPDDDEDTRITVKKISVTGRASVSHRTSK